jgi:hypothetical protein
MEIPPEKWAEGETTTLSVEGGACVPPAFCAPLARLLSSSLLLLLLLLLVWARFTRVTMPLHHPHRRHV